VSIECAQISLGDLFDFKNGRGFRKAEWRKSGLPIIRIQNLNDPNARFNHFQGDYDPSIYVAKGDLLYSWSGSVGTSFGPHLWQGQEGLLNQHIFKLEPKRPISRIYAYYMLRHITKEIEQSVNGAVGLVHVSKSKLESFKIPVPELTEQQRIVAKIDDVEAEMFRLAQVTERSREASDELFNRIIEDQIAEFYSSYPVRRIGDVLAVARGGSPRPIAAFLTSSSDGVNWVKISDATASRKYIYETVEKIKPEGVSRSRLVTSGDFLLSNSMSFGRPYIMRTTGCIHDGWLVLSDSEKQFDEDYLFQLFSSRRLYSEFSRRAQGSTVSNLNSALVSDVSIPVPPIKVQKAFATQVGEIEADVSRLAELTTIKASKLKDLRASALAAVFRGDL